MTLPLRSFGSTGLRVPLLGFGAMQVGDPALDEARAARLLNHVLDAGLTLLDTARSYGLAEERIGRHVAARRDEFVLSTKVGYDIAGVRDWTYDCVVRGVDAARDRLRTDVIDIVHLHSCPLETLQSGEVTQALIDCRERGKLRLAAYSGDDAPLRHAAASGVFDSLQASVNLCDQQALPTLLEARARGLGTIAKRSLCGRPWVGTYTGDYAHDIYRRRFEQLAPGLGFAPWDWDDFALRFTAFSRGVDCVIVGGKDAANVDRNVATVASGPLKLEERAAVVAAYEALGRDWGGLV
jgi:aryl-alcohol dehydrogenase-like predicted oxidoreductase